MATNLPPTNTAELNLARSILGQRYPSAQGYSIKSTGPVMDRPVSLPRGVQLLPAQTCGFMVERLEGSRRMCRAVLSYAHTDVSNMPVFVAGIKLSLEKLDRTGVLGERTPAMILLGSRIEYFLYKAQNPAPGIAGQGGASGGALRPGKQLFPSTAESS